MKNFFSCLTTIVAVIAFPVIIYFANAKLNVETPKAIGYMPKYINISHNSDLMYTISWKTDSPCVGHIAWGINKDALDQIAIQEDTKIKVTSHSMDIVSNKNHFYYVIYSNDTAFSNPNNLPYEYPNV